MDKHIASVIQFSKNNMLVTVSFVLVLIMTIIVILVVASPDDQVPPSDEIITTPSAPPVIFPTPEPGDIVIDQVPVDNFYEDALEINQYEDAIIVETAKYRIVYLAAFKQFKISVLTEPIDAVRQEAEQAFLEKLDIEQVYACALSVEVYIDFNIDSERAGTVSTLSFCK